MAGEKKSKKKNTKKFFILPTTLYKKSFISKKQNKDVLFVYDKENTPNGRNADYKTLENVLELDFTDIKDDSNMEDSKKKIKIQMDKLKNAVNKHKELVAPEIALGQKLVTRNRPATRSFQILNNKLKKYEMTTSVEIKKLKEKSKKKKKGTLAQEKLDDHQNTKSRFGLFQALKTKSSGATKKKAKLRKTAAQIAKEEVDATNKIKKLLKDTHSKCQKCEMVYDTTRVPLYTEVSTESKDFIKRVEKGIALCNSCMSQCKQMTESMAKVKTPKRKQKLELRFPKSCRIDHTAQSKALRIKKELDETLIAQHKLINY